MLGLFAGTFAGTLYMLGIVILVDFFGFLVWSPLFTSACIGHSRDVFCLFDFSSCELVFVA